MSKYADILGKEVDIHIERYGKRLMVAIRKNLNGGVLVSRSGTLKKSVVLKRTRKMNFKIQTDVKHGLFQELGYRQKAGFFPIVINGQKTWRHTKGGFRRKQWFKPALETAKYKWAYKREMTKAVKVSLTKLKEFKDL